MNTMKTVLLPNCRTALAAVAFIAAGLGSVQAAEYYLRQSQADGWNWHTTAAGNLNSWHTTPSGTAVQLTAMDAEGHYYTNGFNLRTPTGSGDNTFGGALLVLQNGNLTVKGTGSATVTNFRTEGTAAITTSNLNNQTYTLTFTNFEQSGTTTFSATATNRRFAVTVGTLTGAGDIIFAGVAAGNTQTFNISDATDFSGSFSLTGGTLQFADNLVAASASLSIATGSFVNLTHSISVSALTIGGDVLGDGTYDFDYLSTNYGDIFTAGDALNGQIIVGSTIPEPSAFALLAGGLAFGAVALRRRRRG